jgi:hypothetical protein
VLVYEVGRRGQRVGADLRGRLSNHCETSPSLFEPPNTCQRWSYVIISCHVWNTKVNGLFQTNKKARQSVTTPLSCPSFPRQDSAGRCFPSRPCALNLVCLLAPHSRVHVSAIYTPSGHGVGGCLLCLDMAQHPAAFEGGQVWCGVVCEGSRMP